SWSRLHQVSRTSVAASGSCNLTGAEAPSHALDSGDLRREPAGAAEGGTTLNAFDNALLAAGIGNIDLLKVSSIMPPAIRTIPVPRIKPGSCPDCLCRAAERCAGRGHRRGDRLGVIMEVHGRLGAKDPERLIEQMLEEAFQVRGARTRKRDVQAAEPRVQRTGCAVAAVTLLSIDHLLDPATVRRGNRKAFLI